VALWARAPYPEKNSGQANDRDSAGDSGRYSGNGLRWREVGLYRKLIVFGGRGERAVVEWGWLFDNWQEGPRTEAKLESQIGNLRSQRGRGNAL